MNYSMSTFQLVVQKRLFSSKKLGINGLTWGIIILPIFTALLRLGKKEIPLNACWMVMGIK